MRNAALTVHVSTKLNRSHVVTGGEALILPALGRSERDLTGGREQRVTVEDSMSAVHASRGPARPRRRSTCAPRSTSSARWRWPRSATDTPVPWAELRADYTEIRRRIARVVPGCASYDEQVDHPGGFVLPHPPRDSRTFETDARPGGHRPSTPVEVLECPRVACCCRRCARTTSSTPRSTASTTATAASRAVAGWCSCTPTTSPRWATTEGDVVDLVSEWTRRRRERAARDFRIVAYDQPRGCAAAYYPETNPLVPLDSTAEGSNHPGLQVGRRPPRPAGAARGTHPSRTSDDAGAGSPGPTSRTT